MIQIICNRCKKEIESIQKVGYIQFRYQNPFENSVIGDSILDRNHYCEECMAAIEQFIQNKQEVNVNLNVDGAEIAQSLNAQDGTDKVPESIERTQKTVSEKEESNSEKPKQKRRKHIDIKKIMALKNAGWSIAKIADEMGMQPQSVSNAIYLYKKRTENVG